MELPLPVQAPTAWVPSRMPSEKIDHHLPAAQPVAAAINAEHGAYVAQMCKGCHGPGPSGGAIRRLAGLACRQPDARRGQRLSAIPGCRQLRHHVAQWQAPGRQRDPGHAFESLRELNDTDAQAIYAFPQDAGTQTSWAARVPGANTASTCELEVPARRLGGEAHHGTIPDAEAVLHLQSVASASTPRSAGTDADVGRVRTGRAGAWSRACGP